MSTVTVPIKITCPDWCIVDPENHAEELSNWEGRVLHSGEWVADWHLASTTNTEGKLWLEEGQTAVGVMGQDDFVDLNQLERDAHAILAMVALAREAQK